MHSSRMRTIRCSSCLLGAGGGVCPGGCLPHPSCEQNETLVKTLPCHNYIADGKYIKTQSDFNESIFTVCNSSCGKVMFSQVSVCPQGGGVHPLGRHPPGQRHTHTSRHPSAWADTPPPPRWQMVTAADGTHPTGMHSCLNFNTRKLYLCCLPLLGTNLF